MDANPEHERIAPGPLKLAQAIQSSGLTKAEIADLAGMHPTALSHLLAGRRRATVAQRVRLSRVLGRRIAELFEPVEPWPNAAKRRDAS